VLRLQMIGDERDVRELVAGSRAMREIFEAEPMRGYVSGERTPGSAVQSDDEWEGFLREAAWGQAHPIGTCRMGGDGDADAVVDPQLRVRGVDALRVVDASVMPTEPSGNTNAPTIMIAEKAAEMIRTSERRPTSVATV
jgi:choline dehydrogenase